MQENGDPISIDQLRHQRDKHTPTREKGKKAARCELSQAAIDLVVTHTDTRHKELLGLVNDQIRLVRATADGRGRAARARGGRRGRGAGGAPAGETGCAGAGGWGKHQH